MYEQELRGAGARFLQRVVRPYTRPRVRCWSGCSRCSARRMRWLGGGSTVASMRAGGLADSEKAAVRAALLAALDEPEAQLAAQLLLVLAQVARLDGLAAWPELMPSLLHAAARTAPRDAARGTFALFRVVKMQASRRLLVHRKQFIVLAAELSPSAAAPRSPPWPAAARPLPPLHEAAAWLAAATAAAATAHQRSGWGGARAVQARPPAPIGGVGAASRQREACAFREAWAAPLRTREPHLVCRMAHASRVLDLTPQVR